LTAEEERASNGRSRLEKISASIKGLMRLLDERALLAGQKVDEFVTSSESR
jgi:hypothetical protein